MSEWPKDFRRRLTGELCELCLEGRPEETPSRIRFYASDVSDAYLHRRGVQRGFAAVVWRRGHAVEPTELQASQADAFWHDALTVGRAIQQHYRPLKVNYQLLGNGAPHLHWLIAPRFSDDVAPGRPLPPDGYVTFDETELRRDVAALGLLIPGASQPTGGHASGIVMRKAGRVDPR